LTFDAEGLVSSTTGVFNPVEGLSMPIYEYYCDSCGHEFEVMQKITDRPVRKCEKCGKLKAKRAISRTSFVLKGSGWYVTDYGGAKASRAREEKKSGDESPAEKAESKAPAKKAANA
jgi:putative FmdB family regulatory protein